MRTPFTSGSIVVLYLREPRERVWGMLVDLSGPGVSVRGLDMNSFDAWIRERAGEREPAFRASTIFYPMSRVERILIDEGAAGVPSLDARCRAVTGRGLLDLLKDEEESTMGAEGSA